MFGCYLVSTSRDTTQAGEHQDSGTLCGLGCVRDYSSVDASGAETVLNFANDSLVHTSVRIRLRDL